MPIVLSTLWERSCDCWCSSVPRSSCGHAAFLRLACKLVDPRAEWSRRKCAEKEFAIFRIYAKMCRKVCRKGCQKGSPDRLLQQALFCTPCCKHAFAVLCTNQLEKECGTCFAASFFILVFHPFSTTLLGSPFFTFFWVTKGDRT